VRGMDEGEKVEEEEVAMVEVDAGEAPVVAKAGARGSVREVRREVKLAMMNKLMAEVASIRRQVGKAVRRRLGGKPANVGGGVATLFELRVVGPGKQLRRERRQARRRVVREMGLERPLTAEERGRVRAAVRETLGMPAEDMEGEAPPVRSQRGMRPMERRFKRLQRVSARKLAKFERMGDALPEGKRDKMARWRDIQSKTFEDFREQRMARRGLPLPVSE